MAAARRPKSIAYSFGEFDFMTTNHAVFINDKTDVKEEYEYHSVMDFMLTGPLGYALTASPKYQKTAITEAWSNHENQPDNITFSVGDHTVVVTRESIASVLKLPIQDVYDNLATETEIKGMLAILGYQGDLDDMSTLKKNNLKRKEWNFFFDQLAKCFSGKCSSFEQITNITSQIAYSLINNTVINIGDLLFTQLSTRLGIETNGRHRVYYHRFLMMILNASIPNINTIYGQANSCAAYAQPKRIFSDLNRQYRDRAPSPVVVPDHMKVLLLTNLPNLYNTSSFSGEVVQELLVENDPPAPTKVAKSPSTKPVSKPNLKMKQPKNRLRTTQPQCEQERLRTETELDTDNLDSENLDADLVSDQPKGHEVVTHDGSGGTRVLVAPRFTERQFDYFDQTWIASEMDARSQGYSLEDFECISQIQKKDRDDARRDYDLTLNLQNQRMTAAEQEAMETDADTDFEDEMPLLHHWQQKPVTDWINAHERFGDDCHSFRLICKIWVAEKFRSSMKNVFWDKYNMYPVEATEGQALVDARSILELGPTQEILQLPDSNEASGSKESESKASESTLPESTTQILSPPPTSTPTTTIPTTTSTPMATLGQPSGSQDQIFSSLSTIDVRLSAIEANQDGIKTSLAELRNQQDSMFAQHLMMMDLVTQIADKLGKSKKEGKRKTGESSSCKDNLKKDNLKKKKKDDDNEKKDGRRDDRPLTQDLTVLGKRHMPESGSETRGSSQPPKRRRSETAEITGEANEEVIVQSQIIQQIIQGPTTTEPPAIENKAECQSESTEITPEITPVSTPVPLIGEALAVSEDRMMKSYILKNPEYSEIPDDKSHQASDKLDGVGLASSTPVKLESKKRPKVGTDDDNRPRLKRKKHRPRILDDSIKSKTPKAQARGFQPKTPMQPSARKPRAKRSYVKKNNFNKVLDMSEDVVQGEDVPNRSCRRALNFNLDKEVALKPLKKHEKHGQLVVFNPLKKLEKPEVDLDNQSIRAYNMLSTEDETVTNDDPYSEDKEYWDRERQVTRNRVDSLLSVLRPLLGNRRFSRWKGSVIDSVVGAYLTQNVSDQLSSSVYMSLASQFPARDSNRSSSHFESVSVCPQLLPQDVGKERCGHKSTFQVIDHCDSANGSESNVNRAPTRINLACENDSSFQSKGVPIEGKSTNKKKKNDNKDWDNLRKFYSCERARTDENRDAVDWESVRQVSVNVLAEILKPRGQHRVLADRIMKFLDLTVQEHGSLDLEWLRDVPPLDAKAYLLSRYGLGLKSVECIRLLALYARAFPVDVNVARVLTRLGWVRLRQLPKGLLFHLLEEYPLLANIQKYLYPRLCTLEYLTLYELHYILITFGKVYCTKINPRCNTCPLSGQCKHYASLSARLALPAPESKNKTTAKNRVNIRRTNRKSNVGVEPVIEMPASPEHHIEESEPIDIEDLYKDPALPDLNVTPDCPKCDDDIPIIRINSTTHDNRNEVEMSIQIGNMSQALGVPAVPSATPIPNFRERLKSVHQVFLLPDSHPILEELQMDKRDPDDLSPYLFKHWAVLEEGSVSDRVPLGKTSDSFCCSSPQVCSEIVCSSSSFTKNDEHSSTDTVSGTLMIPVRSANNGRFPLNGTYFQINEVFADEESTQVPIIVPKHWLNNLPRSLLYCGSSVWATFKGLSLDQMSHAFNHGYYCNRGFDRKTRRTTNLSAQFHIKTSMQGNKNKGRILGGKEQAK